MFADFISGLRKAGVPVSITEHLHLLGAMQAGAARFSTEDFYYLARATLVKDERYFDRFDTEFGRYFKALEPPEGEPAGVVPEDWLRALAEKHLSPEEMARIESLGGFEALMETLKQRLAEQEGRHHGGSKWIGTGGTSPFGHSGYHPEGVRIGGQSRHRRAAKVWEKREYKDLDDGAQLNTRGLKLALRKLRRFARQGAATELDMAGTIQATASKGGLLDLQMRPERHNAVKVVLFLDVGGSMDDHVQATSELFSAARSEFKHLEHFYFHNCVYDKVWRASGEARVPTLEVMRTYGPDYRLIFVGDAAMSPYEISHVGGAVDFWNEEPGMVWLQRLTGHFRRSAWINPTPKAGWGHTQSIGMIGELMAGRMYPMTLHGLDDMIAELRK
jgi:uncharacterized protein with von Willebrand factor type A (vWA) domain